MSDPIERLEKLSEPQTPSNALTLRMVLHVIRKRLWMILGFAFAIPLLVAFVVSKQPKIYEASTNLVIESSVPQYLGQDFKDVVELEMNWWGSQEMMQTELRVLHSYSQAVAVAKALCDKHIGHGDAFNHLLPDGNCAS